MKCPYKNFEDCIVEKCPSCVYEEITETHSEVIGSPAFLSIEEAQKRGYRPAVINSERKTYAFKSCRLIENKAPFVSTKTENITNIKNTSTVVNHSIF